MRGERRRIVSRHWRIPAAAERRGTPLRAQRPARPPLFTYPASPESRKHGLHSGVNSRGKPLRPGPSLPPGLPAATLGDSQHSVRLREDGPSSASGSSVRAGASVLPCLSSSPSPQQVAQRPGRSRCPDRCLCNEGSSSAGAEGAARVAGGLAVCGHQTRYPDVRRGCENRLLVPIFF